MYVFDIFVLSLTYCLIAAIFAAIFAAILEGKDNTLGRAFIWPLIVLIASIKAIRSVYLETKAELDDWKTVKKKE